MFGLCLCDHIGFGGMGKLCPFKNSGVFCAGEWRNGCGGIARDRLVGSACVGNAAFLCGDLIEIGLYVFILFFDSPG